MNPAVKVKNLTFSYSSEPLIKDLSFEVERGTFLSIAGPNGSGKTTLLNLLFSLLKPQAGSIEIDSTPLNNFSMQKLAQKIAVVRQEFVPVFDFTAYQIVSMARLPFSGALGFESQIDKELIKEALEITDTARFAARSMRNLSSGERQRVFIARAFAQDTGILLLDEPTNFLDLRHQVKIFDLLKQAQKEKGKTIIAVTHDINLAVQYADFALLIGSAGRCSYGPADEIFTSRHIEELFTVKIATITAGGVSFFVPKGNLSKNAGTGQ